MASRAHGWEIRIVPMTVAPPPRTGGTAQGPWSTEPSTAFAPDHAEPEPITAGTPTLPEPVATARTVATGLLFATVALVLAGTALGTLAAIRLLASGHVRLQFGDLATALMAVSFAVTYTALLLALTRNWAALRPSTLILAVVGSLAWPLSGLPLPAALLVTIAVGLSLGRDHRTPGGHRVRGTWPVGVLSVAALTLVIAGVALAEANSPRREAATATTETGTKAAASDDTKATGEIPTADAPFAGGPASGIGAPGAFGAAGEVGTRDAPPTDGTTGTDDAPGAVDETVTDVTTPADGTADTTLPTGADTAGDLGIGANAEPGEFVAAYYGALNERRFDAAWASLSPTIQTSFGGLEHWRNGYGRTVSSTPRDIVVTTPSSGTATVKHVLVARDKGCAARRFAVTWKLRRVSEGWSVDVLRASALSASRCG